MSHFAAAHDRELGKSLVQSLAMCLFLDDHDREQETLLVQP